MPGKVIYPEADLEVEKELYPINTGYRLTGGFNLDIEGLPKGKHVPVLCPLNIDFKQRKARVVNNVRVYEKAESGATTVKVAKGSFANIGVSYMLSKANFVTVSAVDTSNADYDVLTVSAVSATIDANAVLTECTVASTATAKRSANFLNYARTKIEDGATVSALGQAYEINEAELYIPLTKADKEGLGDRFMFI